MKTLGACAVVLCLGASLAAQTPDKKVKGPRAPAAVPSPVAPAGGGSFHDFVPANAGLVVTLASRQRLEQVLAAVNAEVKKRFPEPSPLDDPGAAIDQVLPMALQATGPVSGIDATRPVGFALGLDLQKYLFVPAADADGLKGGLAAGTFTEKGSYVVVTQATEYAAGKTPFRPVGKGDLVLSIRPQPWIRQFKPLVAGFLKNATAQATAVSGQTNVQQILDAEVEFFSRALDGLSQLDVALSIEKGDLNVTIYLAPDGKGALKDLLSTLQSAPALAEGALEGLLGGPAWAEMEVALPPAALRVFLGLVPWSAIDPPSTAAGAPGQAPGQKADRGSGDQGAGYFRGLFEKLLSYTDGNIVYRFGMDGSGKLTGSGAGGITDRAGYRKLLLESYSKESLERMARSPLFGGQPIQIDFKENLFQVAGLPVDSMEQTVPLPGQAPLHMAYQILLLDKVGLFTIGSDVKDSKAMKSLHAAWTRRATPAPTTPGSPNKLARGKLFWDQFARFVLQQAATFAAAQGAPAPAGQDSGNIPPATTRCELYAGKSSIMFIARTKLSEALDLVHFLRELTLRQSGGVPPGLEVPPEPVEEDEAK